MFVSDHDYFDPKKRVYHLIVFVFLLCCETVTRVRDRTSIEDHFLFSRKFRSSSFCFCLVCRNFRRIRRIRRVERVSDVRNVTGRARVPSVRREGGRKEGREAQDKAEPSHLSRETNFSQNPSRRNNVSPRARFEKPVSQRVVAQ